LSDSAGAPRRVLFIEDNRAALDGYSAYLAGSGYEVLPAATGERALALATAWTPDLIVLDLGLPDIDGWEVARQLRASPVTSKIPIIALTGADLPHEVVSAMRAGCDRHISKPCEPAVLLAAIRKLLGD
jgi:CheY-like chemotaxis protein